MGLSVVRDLREVRAAAGPEEIERFETDVFAGFVLARCAAGLSDNTIRSDVSHLEQGADLVGETVMGHASRGCGLVFRHGAACSADPHETRSGAGT